MPKPKSRKPRSDSVRRTNCLRARGPGSPIPSIDGLADVVVRGGRELLGIDDPLEAEAWASAMLGTFYKTDAPLEARDELERGLWPAVVRKAEAATDTSGLAVLEALAAVADDNVAGPARAAATRLRAAGVAGPAWVAEIGSVVYENAWAITDVFGDQEAYYATFRYPGRPAHLVNALYDKAMGEIIKDGFVGYFRGDPRSSIRPEPGTAIADSDPGLMARRILDGIASGDMYLDNAWTPEFKRFRALILARMRLLPAAPATEPPEPPSEDARTTLTSEFLASPYIAADPDEADTIASLCLDYSCDYLGEDGLRWSPIVVEQFMLDYLPRKVALNLRQVRQLPAVLRGWVRFALTKRGLEERWIVETEEAVNRFAKEFRVAMTDPSQFGPAKGLANAMLADRVDVLDQAAIDRWVDAFNQRPFAERNELLGRGEPQ